MKKYNYTYNLKVETNSIAVAAAIDGFINQLKSKEGLPKGCVVEVSDIDLSIVNLETN